MASDYILFNFKNNKILKNIYIVFLKMFDFFVSVVFLAGKIIENAKTTNVTV